MQTKGKPPFEYCAARFLDQWERKERPLHVALSGNPSSDAVRKALASFQVARGFAGLSGKAASVVAALLDASNQLDEQNVVTRVDMLADRFEKDFGTRNLSAASKLLWLRCRSPVLIFDARAVNALGRLRHELKGSSYHTFYHAWRREYDSRQTELEYAIHALEGIKPFTASWYRSSVTFRADIRARWFSERTFDLFLWELGRES